MGTYERCGKEVLHAESQDDGRTKYVSVAQAIDADAAHMIAVFLNAPRGEDGGPWDYMAEADKTNSTIFRPQNINRDAFVANLKACSEIAAVMNIYKKLLVRGKTPEELSLPMPLLHESLAVEFDPNNVSETTINVLHGAVGIITEAGEVADLLLDAIERGVRDDVNVIEEAGDLRWYIARMLRGIGKTDYDCERTNINKLHGRHGETFNAERDANRNLDAERMQLETDHGALFDEAIAEKITADGREQLAAKMKAIEEAGSICTCGEEKTACPVHEAASEQDFGRPSNPVVAAQALGKPLPEPRTADMAAQAAAERSGLPNVGTIPKGGVRD